MATPITAIEMADSMIINDDSLLFAVTTVSSLTESQFQGQKALLRTHLGSGNYVCLCDAGTLLLISADRAKTLHLQVRLMFAEKAFVVCFDIHGFDTVFK
jgi:hypothetical protein